MGKTNNKASISKTRVIPTKVGSKETERHQKVNQY